MHMRQSKYMGMILICMLKYKRTCWFLKEIGLISWALTKWEGNLIKPKYQRNYISSSLVLINLLVLSGLEECGPISWTMHTWMYKGWWLVCTLADLLIHLRKKKTCLSIQREDQHDAAVVSHAKLAVRPAAVGCARDGLHASTSLCSFSEYVRRSRSPSAGSPLIKVACSWFSIIDMEPWSFSEGL
jgi:hypothetical protein